MAGWRELGAGVVCASSSKRAREVFFSQGIRRKETNLQSAAVGVERGREHVHGALLRNPHSPFRTLHSFHFAAFLSVSRVYTRQAQKDARRLSAAGLRSKAEKLREILKKIPTRPLLPLKNCGAIWQGPFPVASISNIVSFIRFLMTLADQGHSDMDTL